MKKIVFPQIEKGIKFEHSRGLRGFLSKMEVGDSFLVDKDERRMYMASAYPLKPKKFKCRLIDDKARIWRTE